MTLRVATATILAGAAALLGLAAPANAGPFLGIIPVPGLLGPEQDLRGPLYLSVGGQNVASSSIAYDLGFGVVGEKGELNLRLATTPSDPLAYFVTDAWGAFTGQTGTFLPLNLRPYMGLGAGLYMLTPAGGSNFDAWLPIYVPIGLRYALPLGPLSIGAEGTYFYELADYSGNRKTFDVTRMRYEASVRFGVLSVSAYSESGKFINGTGARLSLNF